MPRIFSLPLQFDERGLLPPGIHDATIEEVAAVFGRFQRSDRRLILTRKLKLYLLELARTEWTCSVINDGSFVMLQVDEPNDIDAILLLPPEWNPPAEIRPFEYNVLSKRSTKRDFGIEVYPAVSGSELESRMLDLFELVRIEWCEKFGWPPDQKKGVVRIVS